MIFDSYRGEYHHGKMSDPETFNVLTSIILHMAHKVNKKHFPWDRGQVREA